MKHTPREYQFKSEATRSIEHAFYMYVRDHGYRKALDEFSKRTVVCYYYEDSQWICITPEEFVCLMGEDVITIGRGIYRLEFEYDLPYLTFAGDTEEKEEYVFTSFVD